jgi:hypothetical protein
MFGVLRQLVEEDLALPLSQPHLADVALDVYFREEPSRQLSE